MGSGKIDARAIRAAAMAAWDKQAQEQALAAEQAREGEGLRAARLLANVLGVNGDELRDRGYLGSYEHARPCTFAMGGPDGEDPDEYCYCQGWGWDNEGPQEWALRVVLPSQERVPAWQSGPVTDLASLGRALDARDAERQRQALQAQDLAQRQAVEQPPEWATATLEHTAGDTGEVLGVVGQALEALSASLSYVGQVLAALPEAQEG